MTEKSPFQLSVDAKTDRDAQAKEYARGDELVEIAFAMGWLACSRRIMEHI